MLDTIILLTGPVEKTALASVLRQHNPGLAIHGANSLADLEGLEPDLLRRARLISFVTPVIVPARLLETIGFGAYNFHPAPPQYPGWMPSHLAIYDRARFFGATAHVMTERVDAGPIVGVELFDIKPDMSVLDLEKLALIELARIFWRLAPMLATQGEPLPELAVKWSARKSTHRMFAGMCDIPTGISKEELDRRIKAFVGGYVQYNPTVILHGHRFRYVAPDVTVTTEAPGIVSTEQIAEVA